MKGIAKGLIAVGLGLVFLATPANAQVSWSVGAGFSLPNGDMKNFVKTGFHGMGAADIALTGSPISVRADGMYNVFSSKFSGGTSLNMLAISADAKYGFAPGPVSPYILGGPTWARSSCSGCTGVSSFGFNVGGGVGFGMGALKLFAEARYFSTTKNGASSNWIPITLGIHF
ncbi:MAG: hypothetical protein ABIQ41_07830 [Gemmatimonadales bacterium]